MVSFDVFDATFQYFNDMVVIQTIVDVQPFLPAFYYTALLQVLKLVAGSGLGQPGDLAQFCDAAFSFAETN